MFLLVADDLVPLVMKRSLPVLFRLPGIIDDRLFARSVMIIGIPGSPVLVRVEIGKRYSCFKEIFLFRKKGKLFAPRVFDFHLSLVTCTL